MDGEDLTTATVDDRKLLDPLTRWLKDGIGMDDGGYLWHCSKGRRLTQHGDLTRENNPAIALDHEGGRDGSRVCPRGVKPITVAPGRAEFVAIGSGPGFFALNV